MNDVQPSKYRLTKLSESWFDLYTDNISHVRRVLELFVCTSCMIKSPDHIYDFTLPLNYDELPTYDKVMWLLSTSCGAEFILEEDGEAPTYDVVEPDFVDGD